MPIKWKFLFVSACVAFGLATQAAAGINTLAEETAEPEKVAKKVYFGPAPGQIKQLYNIGMPKRIGILSFIIDDQGSHTYSALAETYGGKFYESWGMGEKNANVFASNMANIAVPVIKERFAEKNMAVLTPAEFLDTQKKIDAYFNYDLTKGGLQKFTEGTLNFFAKNPTAAAEADGYKWIPLYASFLTQPILGELEELRKELGLDAMMVVTTRTKTSKNTSHIYAVNMQLVGPNPEPRPENEKYVKYWWPAIMYPSATFGKGFKGAVFHKWATSKEDEWTSYDGYEVIIDAISTRTLAELQKHYDKGAKEAQK